jgi:enterochelin esterase-like enzyme
MSPSLRIVWYVAWGMLLAACQNANPLALPTDTPPPTFTIAPTPSVTVAAESTVGFENFLIEIENLKPNQRQSIVNRYLANIRESPLTTNNQAIFLWRGAAASVRLIGDMNDWDSEKSLELVRIEGTDLWYLIAEYEPDARLDYRFLIDGQQLELDPLNPRIVAGSSGPNSVLAMPEHPTQLDPRAVGNIPPGTITSYTIDSDYLNQTRTLFVYQPASQLVGERLPLVIVNNGSDYLNLIDVPSLLDQRIADRQLPPIVVAFVPAIDASQDYTLNDNYVHFLADELVPFVQRHYSTTDDSSATIVIGAASGGRSAVYASISRPDVFGQAASQSGIFSLEDISAIRQAAQLIESSTGAKSKIHLIVGTYETNVDTGGERQDILAANQLLASAMDDVQMDALLDEKPEGHSWGFWQWTFSQVLQEMLK